MVNTIDDWKILLDYTGGKLGFYQLKETDGRVEVRILTGRLGFKKDYEPDDKELNEILTFCENHRFIRISEYLREEEFFR